ncbi:MAG: hypothetical protein WCQ32_03670 [bacterium]
MTNIHPLFVHFPIALLFIYSIIKLLPTKKYFPSITWRDIERITLTIGVLGAFIALQTGDAAEHVFRPVRSIVEAHSNFAGLATIIYIVLLVVEIIATLQEKNMLVKIQSNFVQKILNWYQAFFGGKVVSGILAFLGLIAISITGLLGGVMVYGPSADPVAVLVLKLLKLN